MLVGGSLGDVFGARKIFAMGVCGFGAASLACGIAPTAAALVAARALQGAAGALLTPAALAVIIATFGRTSEAGPLASGRHGAPSPQSRVRWSAASSWNWRAGGGSSW
jgi:MFS family permease